MKSAFAEIKNLSNFMIYGFIELKQILNSFM